MPINLNNLNKIDPIIVNEVYRKTAENVVNNSEGIKASKDKNPDKERQYPNKKRLKQKLKKLNELLENMDVDLIFEFNEGVVVVSDKDGNVVKTISGDSVDELYEKIDTMQGILVDAKK